MKKEIKFKICVDCKEKFPRTKEYFYFSLKKGDKTPQPASRCKSCQKNYIVENQRKKGWSKVSDHVKEYRKNYQRNYNDTKRGRTPKGKTLKRLEDEGLICVVNFPNVKQEVKKTLNRRLQNSFRRRIKKQLKKFNQKINGSIFEKLGYKIQDLKKHLEKQFEPWMTWKNRGSYNSESWKEDDSSTWTWHIDHIIPCCQLEYDSMEHPNFLKCWSLNNLRPLSAKLNCELGGDLEIFRWKFLAKKDGK